MRIAFFGTPQPAAKILEDLIAAGHEIALAVTQPDRGRGRGRKVSFSPVKEVALKQTLPVEQPEEVKNNPVFSALLNSLSPDLAVVVAYGKILPKEILAVPRYGFLNIHASLLPKYRGAAPIQWALLKGEKETGITIFKLSELLDAGPILAQEKVPIDENDDAEALSEKLFEKGAGLLLEAIRQIEKGTAKFFPQNDALASYAPSLSKESGEIDWKKGAQEIHDRVRALITWPVAHTFFRGRRLMLTKTRINVIDLSVRERLPGMILEVTKKDGFIVASGRGDLLVEEVLPEAGKKMKAYDFAIGHDVRAGEILPS